MQRETPEGIVISCDFCGVDWDEVKPMLEGHKGSVMCLDCLRRALDEAGPAEEPFTCTLGLTEHDAGKLCWRHPAPEPSPGLNADAVAAWQHIRLAAKTFQKDKDIDFRWDPAEYPKS